MAEEVDKSQQVDDRIKQLASSNIFKIIVIAIELLAIAVLIYTYFYTWLPDEKLLMIHQAAGYYVCTPPQTLVNINITNRGIV